VSARVREEGESSLKEGVKWKRAKEKVNASIGKRKSGMKCTQLKLDQAWVVFSDWE